MEIKKQLKTVDTILGFCASKDWIQKTSLFPSYIDLDGDQTLDPDELSNPLHQLKEQYKDLEHKLELLQASDRPIREDFRVIDEEGKINFEKLSKINAKTQTDHSANLKSISDSLHRLTILEKSMMKRNFKEVDQDRTINLMQPDVECVQEAIQASKSLDELRFNTLAIYRNLENQQTKLENLFRETKLTL